MRSLGTATVLLALLLTGCGSGDGDADDVPTITTRPSTASSAPSATSSATSATSSATSATSSATSATSSATSSEPPLTETAGPSPEPPTDDPVGPATYREAVARIDKVSGTAPAPIATTRFSTPDDVVYCLLDDDVIGPSCELRVGFIEDDVCGGAAEGVGRIETFEGRARPVCNSDTIREPGAREITPNAVVLLTGGGVECAVERAGVTCVDTDNRTGFFLGPGEYHVF